MLAGCRGRGNTTTSGDSTSNNPTSGTIAPTSGTTVTSGTSATSSSGISSSSGSSSSSSPTSITPPATTITIAEAISKCEALKDTSSEKEIIGSEEVTIRGNVYQDITIYLNERHVTFFTDGTNEIGVVHTPSIWNIADNKIGKNTSNYYVTAKTGYFYSKPTLFLYSAPIESSSPTIDVDWSTRTYEEYTSVASFHDYCETIDYNKKGHGYDKYVSMKQIKCIAKADDNSWLFTDGTHVQGIYHQTSNTTFTVGNYYNVYGIASVYRWKPSIRVLRYELADGNINLNIPSLAIEKTAVQMYGLGCPDEDTEKNTSTRNFMRTFRYFYKVPNQYFSYYVSSNYYVISGDTSITCSNQTMAATNNKILFNNASMNRLNSVSDVNHCPARDYISQTFTLDFFYCASYQFTKSNGKMMPQVYMFEDFVPRLSFPEIELTNFFSGQSYLISEGHIFWDDIDDAVWSIESETATKLVILAKNVTQSNYEQFKANIDVYSSVTLSPSLSEGNHFVYVHSVSNPKFREGIEYDSVKQEFRIDFVRL